MEYGLQQTIINILSNELRLLEGWDYRVDEELSSREDDQEKIDLLREARSDVGNDMSYHRGIKKYEQLLKPETIKKIKKIKQQREDEEKKRLEYSKWVEEQERNKTIGKVLGTIMIVGILIAMLMIAISGGEAIEQEKSQRFNACMKTYKENYIKNQDAFIMIQEKRLNASLSRMYINGHFESAFGMGSGRIETKYVDRLYRKNQFEKDNNGTNKCRKQKFITEQVDLILKKAKGE